ncbi:MAG: Parvulin-like peptidyl-prolyl isomerase [Chlorobi bacterium OLB6]|nr:MAG: Parvulin-like peptidyl-prolyl isomerase [Chlorobi bacterium OLB6]
MLTDSAVNNIQQQLLAGADFTTLARTHTQRQAMRETSGKYPTALSPKTSAIARKVEELGLKVGQISSPFTIDRGTAIIRLDAIEPPRQKTFEEAMSELAPAYQDQLQKKLTNSWLDSVRKRHTVTLNQKAINAIWR